jgi:rSAM/selenodomain-associated transferase 2
VIDTSVVVPTLDEAETIERTLRRLRRLLPGAELVVADGGSRDRTRELARRLARVVESVPGRGPQLNAGAAEARGELLLFLHADSALRRDPRPDLAAALARAGVVAVHFRQRIRARGCAFRMLEAAAWRRARWTPWVLGDLGLAVRRGTFAAIGGFPEQPLFEDLGISLRLRRHGRIAGIGVRVHCSARRWLRQGLVRTTLVNWMLTVGYLLGMDPVRLARAYRAIR